MIVFLVVLLGVWGKPRLKSWRKKREERKRREEESKDSCVQISAVMDQPDPDHCKEYCIAIRSEQVL